MDEQNCNNCAHYRPHYIRQQTRFTPIDCGHCTENLRKRCFMPCSSWTKNTEIVGQRREDIENTLRNMCRWIAEIAQILKEDIKTENISDDGGENADN